MGVSQEKLWTALSASWVTQLLGRCRTVWHDSFDSRQSLSPNSFTVSFCMLLMAQRFPDLAGSTKSFPSVFLGALQPRGNPFVPLWVLAWEWQLSSRTNSEWEQLLDKLLFFWKSSSGSEGIFKWATQISVRFGHSLCPCRKCVHPAASGTFEALLRSTSSLMWLSSPLSVLVDDKTSECGMHLAVWSTVQWG